MSFEKSSNLELSTKFMLVLAGGFGTRLKTILPNEPKALAPINNEPFLRIQIQNWKRQGLTSFVFLLHHQADRIVSFLNKERTALLKDCKVRWLVESSPMGTGGAIAFAVKELNLSGDFLVTNADTWIGNGITEFSEINSSAIAVVKINDASRFGSIKLDIQCNITAFNEKCSNSLGGFISAGLYQLNSELFKSWNGLPFSLEKNLFQALVTRRMLKAVKLNTDFIDIGVPEDYYRFCRWHLAGDKDFI